MFKLSPEASLDGAVTVETKFIIEYMPYADGDYVKVYLYGLSLAARKLDADDDVTRLARRLDLDRAVVDAAIDYWSERGLMSRLGDDVTYLSVRGARPKIKKYDVDKYSEFNRQAQLFITERMISANEYNEYYALMERLGLDWQAMVLIVKYCADLKGGGVSCPYILAVARNLAEDGYRSYDEVENRLEEYGVYYNDLVAVLGAMGGKRPDYESVKLYKKWTKQLKFDRDTVLHVARTVKRGGASVLDSKLTKYAELGLTKADAIDAYESERLGMYKLTKSLNRALGVYYENVDPEISAYVRPWLDLGFEPDALVAAADYCLHNGLKTLPDLDAVVRGLFAENALTAKAVKTKFGRETEHDADIAEIMNALGVKGAVNAAYRTFYESWTGRLGMPRELIAYAATLSVGKNFAYMNAILTAWHDRGIRSVDAAKSAQSGATAADETTAVVRERMTAEELNALFTDLDEDDNE